MATQVALCTPSWFLCRSLYTPSWFRLAFVFAFVFFIMKCSFNLIFPYTFSRQSLLAYHSVRRGMAAVL